MGVAYPKLICFIFGLTYSYISITGSTLEVLVQNSHLSSKRNENKRQLNFNSISQDEFHKMIYEIVIETNGPA